MTIDEYLEKILSKKTVSNQYNPNEETAYRVICETINQWAQAYNFSNNYYSDKRIYIGTVKSGSKSKNDAIKGTSDVDLFVSISDKNNTYTTEDYYNSLYDFFKKKFGEDKVRKQNVSIGLKYAGVSIDITPGKRIQSYSAWNYDDHFIFQRRNRSLTKTNIHKQRNYVLNSGCLKEIRLMKIWRDCHDLDIPSIAIEVLTIETLKNNYTTGLYNRFKLVLEKIEKDIDKMSIVDPGNSSNNISDSISDDEKRRIKNAAKSSLSYDHGNMVNGKAIIW